MTGANLGTEGFATRIERVVAVKRGRGQDGRGFSIRACYTGGPPVSPRDSLGAAGARIETVWGVGYRFAG